MQFEEFTKAIEILLSLPEALRRRAVIVAEGLSGPDREELLKELSQVHAELKKIAEEEERALAAAEAALLSAERRLAAWDREEAEGAERDQGVQAAEQHLSDFA